MSKKAQSYKKMEKWWLALIVIFYVLYNLPGVPKYGDAPGAIWHGVLTIIPLWIISYAGMFMLHRQRKLKQNVSADADKDRKVEM